MTTDHAILRALFVRDFFIANREMLAPSLFDDESLELFETIAAAHDETAEGAPDLTSDALLVLWTAAHPVATRAEKQSMKDFVDAVGRTELLQPELARKALKALWQRELGRRIANLGIEVSEGRAERLVELRSIIERATDAGYGPDEFGEETSSDLAELLQLTDDGNRFAFNISTVRKVVYGIGRGEFGVIFATPETGKTAFAVSLMAAPGGYAEQGARCLYLGNEEKTGRTKLRAISAWTGMTRAQLAENPVTAQQKFLPVRDKILMYDAQGWSIDQVEACVKHVGADVVIIDQADKLSVTGRFDAGHERLRALYTNLRELAKRRDVALWGVSQASNDAAGKTRLTLHEMEGSKIGKAAEADLIIGIGKLPGEDDAPDRYVTLCKNKISGVHETIICNIRHQLSRYEA